MVDVTEVHFSGGHTAELSLPITKSIEIFQKRTAPTSHVDRIKDNAQNLSSLSFVSLKQNGYEIHVNQNAISHITQEWDPKETHVHFASGEKLVFGQPANEIVDAINKSSGPEGLIDRPLLMVELDNTHYINANRWEDNVRFISSDEDITNANKTKTTLHMQNGDEITVSKKLDVVRDMLDQARRATIQI